MQKGISQNALDRSVVRILGLNEDAMTGRTSKAEAGQEPSAAIVAAMADALGVRAEWLMFGRGERFERAAGGLPSELSAVEVPGAGETERRLVALVAGGEIRAITDATVARLVEEAMHFRRIVSDCIELDARRRKQPAPAPAARRRRRGA